MNRLLARSCFWFCWLMPLPGLASGLANERYRVTALSPATVQVETADTGHTDFQLTFTVLIAEQKPDPIMLLTTLPPRISHRVLAWVTPPSRTAAERLQIGRRTAADAGDGFEEPDVVAEETPRTANLFAAAANVTLTATAVEARDGALHFTFPETTDFTLTARITVPSGSGDPQLQFTLQPKRTGWFSVGYTGAPATATRAALEWWQPYLWQEKRFPDQSYLSPAFQAPLPAALVRTERATYGVLVDADEYPFDPLPQLMNSRFGVALRNPDGHAQPMVFAPILGGIESHREAGQAYSFRLRLVTRAGDIPTVFEALAREQYGFRDYRRNAIASLNETLDNMIDYGLSRYSWFIDELRGPSYSTDVPDSVKNVSALDPLAIALVTDDEQIFRQRALPILEFLLSREQYLFALDREQVRQNPSRTLAGPTAPVTELAEFHALSGGASPFLLALAEDLQHALHSARGTYRRSRVERPENWHNQLALWLATGKPHHLAAAKAGADQHLQERLGEPASEFTSGGPFVLFTPRWIDLFRLYEATGEARYLAGAHAGARRYTMFTWMSPRIPDHDITVHPDGLAPHYWYLAQKGHPPMAAPTESVPAWRLSEIGLTPESSRTMTGHRAIFMATFAPWMMAIAHHTGDTLLHDVARAAIVGRYRSFPGYHINTARTTIYEKADYPLREFTEISVNSFHYNHVWPHTNILLGFLLEDMKLRSAGEIDFPSRYNRSYSYLQNRFYGDRPGRFFGRPAARLWLPRRLLRTDQVELNHLAARDDQGLHLAFANQGPAPVTATVTLNLDLLPALAERPYPIRVWTGEASAEVRAGTFTVTVPAHGLTAVEISGLIVTPRFQNQFGQRTAADAWQQGAVDLPWGRTRAVLLNFGPNLRQAYVYLQEDDTVFRRVHLTYQSQGETRTVTKESYPFEFSIPLAPEDQRFDFHLSGELIDGSTVSSPPAALFP